MNPKTFIGAISCLGALLILVGCNPQASEETIVDGHDPAADSSASTPATTVDLDSVTVPDLRSASVDQLEQSANTGLTALAAQAGPAQSDVARQADAVKESLSSNQPVDALSRLKQLEASTASIPGAPEAIEKTKQMVSAWALKQGFDAAKVEPLLESLQRGDYAGLVSQGSALFGRGELTEEQRTLVTSVLSTFGLDTQAGEALNKVQGLFGGQTK